MCSFLPIFCGVLSKCQGKTLKDGARPAFFLIFVLFSVFFVLFYEFLCCSMYFICCSVTFCVVLYIVCFVTYSVLFVCIRVLNYCHREATQLQLNTSYHIINVVYWYILIHVTSSLFLSTQFLTPVSLSLLLLSYNRSQQDALLLNFILIYNSTYFGQTYCPSSGVSILYSQQLVFVILFMLTVC
jgi:hypothetical protein